jgi:hypothetical protein
MVGLFSGAIVADVDSLTFGAFIISIAVGLGETLGPWAATHKRTRKRVDALVDTFARTMAKMGDWSEEVE